MKDSLSVLVVGLLLFSGCKPASQRQAYSPISQSKAEQVVDRLIELGFLKYVPPAEQGRVRSQLVKAATQGRLDSDLDGSGVSADQRSYPVNAEVLAHGGVGKCILLMKRILEREGVQLDEVEDNWHHERYQVLINREPYVVYDGKTSDAAQTSLERLLEMVSDLLEEAKSDERLFAVGRGKDLRVILLTEEMQNYVDSLGDVLSQNWIPYSGKEVESAEEP